MAHQSLLSAPGYFCPGRWILGCSGGAPSNSALLPLLTVTWQVTFPPYLADLPFLRCPLPASLWYLLLPIPAKLRTQMGTATGRQSLSSRPHVIRSFSREGLQLTTASSSSFLQPPNFLLLETVTNCPFRDGKWGKKYRGIKISLL